MTHDDLAESLAGHVRTPRRLIWTDVQLGPAPSPRPDVFTLEKSFVRPQPAAYEVKVSRSDFFSDVTGGKYLKYFAFAEAVTFAAPVGLIQVREVPKGCGLMAFHPETGMWTTRKRATRQQCDLSGEVLMRLLIEAGAQATPENRKRFRSEWRAAEKVRQRWGDRAARVLRDIDGAERQIEESNRRALAIIEDARKAAKAIRDQERENADAATKLICETLGLESLSHFTYEVAQRLRLLNENAEIQRLRRALLSIRDSIEDYDAELDAFAETLPYRRKKGKAA